MVSSFSSTEAECSVKVESVTLRCMDGRSVGSKAATVGRDVNGARRSARVYPLRSRTTALAAGIRTRVSKPYKSRSELMSVL